MKARYALPMLALLLAACNSGGSDDDSHEPDPPPPTASTPRIWMSVDSVESVPAADGAPEYEKLTGRIRGEVDPAAPANAIITDIQLAQPRNDAGMVEYVSDFVLFRPRNAADGNGILRYDAPNRGNLLTQVAGKPEPLLLRRGYSVLYSAWQGDVPKSSPQRLTLQVPVARAADGGDITGPYRAELIARTATPQLTLPGGVFNGTMIPYAPVSLDNTQPGYQLTRRLRETDPREPIPAARWKFATCDTGSNPFPGTPDPATVCLQGGFDPTYLYELTYVAKDPKVMGVGLAALRDTVSFLRHGQQDADGQPNPVAGRIRHALGQGTSQSGNFMKTFLHLGFNADLAGRKVFDGLYAHVAARQTNLNTRFAVPGGGGGLRTDHTAFGQTAPRALAPDYVDALTGRQSGVMTRCSRTDTCPKFFLGLSGTEFWVLQGSPVLTDAFGLQDLRQPDNARIYYYAGTQHGDGTPAYAPAQGRYPVGTEATFGATFRALWVALEEWVAQDRLPPDSRTPRLDDGTLVRADTLRYPAMQGLNWQGGAALPAFEYLGLYNSYPLLDFGPDFVHEDESGIASRLPPDYAGRDYAILVPKPDADGMDIAGIRSVNAMAPTGTSLGYNYTPPGPWTDLLGLSGSFLPFHTTEAQRLSAGDERPSLEERYGDHAGYVRAIEARAETLVQQRFLLREDADRAIAAARASNVLQGTMP
ncbi:alpha/beta hydrolase domain-containing protein [Bordetella genomosp. 13]|uniref:Alpha/beta hydrolase domain-containing protein n=1 Tax=Bordetella genomosp. 13 TaxID=463040 RepID=A0A1W6ZA67_9BORD|nr:alpha/beta hydrolase domain-containing protein [Bordetella genomosp. 13]ARP94050.1 hypothetical protein CAL15_06435 [Bordetella genomosp. 13]